MIYTYIVIALLIVSILAKCLEILVIKFVLQTVEEIRDAFPLFVRAETKTQNMDEMEWTKDETPSEQE